MLVYHGSNVKVPMPVADYNERDDQDFGQGFYVTPYREEAIMWAETKARENDGYAVINIYELDDNYIDSCRYFEESDDDWFDFLLPCRSGQIDYLQGKYPIVEGPVADDDGFDIFQEYLEGSTTREEAMRELQKLDLGWQICLRTDDVIWQFLTYRGSELV